MSRGASIRRKIFRVFKWVSIVFGVLLVVAVIAGLVMNEPRPATGRTGAEADAVAHAIEAAVNREAWDQTGAIRFTFGGLDHLWDKTRGLSRVRWDDVEVLQRLDARIGVAYVDGARVHGEEEKALVEKAWARWCNDTFWLNPLVKLFDDGVTRSLVRQADGSDALLVEYASGGVTPGDAYLWLLGSDDLPRAWKLWVSVLPIGGVEVAWEGWTTLSTGARIATRHEAGPFTIEVTGVEGAATLEELEPGEDPFRALVGQ